MPAESPRVTRCGSRLKSSSTHCRRLRRSAPSLNSGDRGKVAREGLIDGCLPLSDDLAATGEAEYVVELKWCHRTVEAAYGRGPKGDRVGVAVHEGDVATIHDDLQGITRKEASARTRPALPPESCAAREMAGQVEEH